MQTFLTILIVLGAIYAIYRYRDKLGFTKSPPPPVGSGNGPDKGKGTGLKAILPFLLVLASAVPVARAAPPSANVSWTDPTAYVDGNALSSADIDHYTVTWSSVKTGLAGGSLTVKAPATFPVVVPLSCGDYSFTVTVTTGASALYPNATSSPAGPVTFATGVTCAPNPVSGLTVK